MAYFIYALIDPRTKMVEYIGITDNIRKRFREHVSCKDTNAQKNAWIQELLEETLIPSLEILETVASLDSARKREVSWIEQYLSEKPLFNIQENGASTQKRLAMSRRRVITKEARHPTLGVHYLTETQAAKMQHLSIDNFRRCKEGRNIRCIPIGKSRKVEGVTYTAITEPLFSYRDLKVWHDEPDQW